MRRRPRLRSHYQHTPRWRQRPHRLRTPASGVFLSFRRLGSTDVRPPAENPGQDGPSAVGQQTQELTETVGSNVACGPYERSQSHPSQRLSQTRCSDRSAARPPAVGADSIPHMTSETGPGSASWAVPPTLKVCESARPAQGGGPFLRRKPALTLWSMSHTCRPPESLLPQSHRGLRNSQISTPAPLRYNPFHRHERYSRTRVR